MPHTTPAWAIDTAGWRVADNGDVLSLTPCDSGAATLQFTTHQKTNGFIGDAELQELAEVGSPLLPPRRAVTCGEFRGYTASCLKDDVYRRMWWLANADVYLRATYSCASGQAGKHDAVVDWMLRTLRRVWAAH